MISTLIIGLGQIGMGYDLGLDAASYVYSHARACSLHPGFRLIGGVDPDDNVRDVFAKTFGCPAYQNLNIALEQHQPELVIVAVPTILHARTIDRGLAGSKPRLILCEKPLAYDRLEAKTIVEACATKNVQLYVNYMRRSDPGAIEIKRRIATGEIGLPIKGVAWYSKGFLHNGSHLFNLLEFWLGPMHGFSVLDRGRLWDEIDPEPDVHVVFERGAAVFLAAWEEIFSHYTIELLAATGRLRYEQGGSLIDWQSIGPDPHAHGYTVLSANNAAVRSGMHRSQWSVADQLARASRGAEAQLCSGNEALRTLECMTDIIEAL